MIEDVFICELLFCQGPFVIYEGRYRERETCQIILSTEKGLMFVILAEGKSTHIFMAVFRINFAANF